MKKEIKLDDIKNSPYTVVVLLVLLMLILFGITIWMLNGIKSTKAEIVTARQLLSENVDSLANLEELRARSEEAEAVLSNYEEILPRKLKDVYILEEEIVEEVSSFGLTFVSKEETTQESSTTIETLFKFTVSGSYDDIMVYLQYVTGKKQIQRIDGLTLSIADNGDYTAVITLAVLSQDGAEGIPTPVEEAAKATKATTTAAD